MNRDLLFIDDLQLIIYYHINTVYYACDEDGPGMEAMTETVLEQADLDIFGNTIDILGCLTERQKELIVKNINKRYE